MTQTNYTYRFVFAAGGTAGHITPAIAVAETLKQIKPESEILFIGSKKRMESRIVPKAGFHFKTIWISGFARKFNLQNLLFPLKLSSSVVKSLLILMKFKPRVAIGSGAFVSGPVLQAASILGVKIVLLEQNSYPGVTNRLLEKKAEQIHITFKDSEQYFREKRKLILSGNPIRVQMNLINKIDALKEFKLDNSKKTLLVLGGSGGALSINNAISACSQKLIGENIQILWQTGDFYYSDYKTLESRFIRILPFIENMNAAYSAADLILARSGATTISEVSALGLPVIFVPSPNVAADHQYKNAKSLVDENAAIVLRDNELSEKLFDEIKSVISNEEKLETMRTNIKKFSQPDAAKIVATNIIKLAETF
ncbi:MAG: undecaprenyldiphospho-muramoylpentapeptide beta-N-acetylglucosaminyltransferase [bacterium]